MLLDKKGAREGGEERDYVPVIIGVEMEGAKVDIWEIEDGGKVFSGRAVVVEIPFVGAGSSVVEEAVAAKGDEVVGVEGFDVLAYLVGPGG